MSIATDTQLHLRSVKDLAALADPTCPQCLGRGYTTEFVAADEAPDRLPCGCTPMTVGASTTAAELAYYRPASELADWRTR